MISQFIERGLSKLLEAHTLINPVIKAIYERSGKAYLVGGAVRDLVLGLHTKDLDIEVHGLNLDELSQILSTVGTVLYVGKSFGVLKLEGVPIDWSLPRTDTSGRKPQVFIDPKMSIVEALRRRDLTMNAMAIELSTHEFIDPFHGLNDIHHKILRAPDIAFFSEDPLRFYRVMQFIGRFEMLPDPILQKTCKTMDISTVSIERIEDEFEKLILKSKSPSLGIRWLADIGRLAQILPELADLERVPQDKYWHPEGTVFEHSMEAFDAAEHIEVSSEEDKLILCYAALCHDLGKVSTTFEIDGRIHSPGHAEVGAKLARSLLKRITRKVKIINTVCLLIKYHMQPIQFIKLDAKPAAYRRLALKLAKYTTIDMLGKLALADYRGRNPHGHKPLTKNFPDLEEFLRRAHDAQVLHKPEPQILHGKDIIDLVKPGPEMGRLLKFAYELQLEHGIRDKELLRAKVIEKLEHKDK